jgi:hypothetical protein
VSQRLKNGQNSCPTAVDRQHSFSMPKNFSSERFLSVQTMS